MRTVEAVSIVTFIVSLLCPWRANRMAIAEDRDPLTAFLLNFCKCRGKYCNLLQTTFAACAYLHRSGQCDGHGNRD
jgi:hypothetical protein